MTTEIAHRALLCLPVASDDATALGTDLRRALARGDAASLPPRQECLMWITQLIGAAPVTQGLAALRLWGQTEQPPSGWVAGADPVYLEPRLDHLILHPLPENTLGANAMRETFALLREALDVDVFCEGPWGYLRADPETLSLPMSSARTLSGCEPSPYMPAGPGAETYQRLQSEIQMTLHQMPLQERRVREHQPPLNALWLWGGGVAPDIAPQRLPALFSDEPLLRGYWCCANASARAWPGSIVGCLEEAGGDFVAKPPAAGEHRVGGNASLEALVADAIEHVHAGRIGTLTCVFMDGVAVKLRRRHRLRFWRRGDSLTATASTDGRA